MHDTSIRVVAWVGLRFVKHLHVLIITLCKTKFHSGIFTTHWHNSMNMFADLYLIKQSVRVYHKSYEYMQCTLSIYNLENMCNRYHLIFYDNTNPKMSFMHIMRELTEISITSRVQKVWVVEFVNGPTEIPQWPFLSVPVRAFERGVCPKLHPKRV